MFPFIEFVNEHFDEKDHFHILCSAEQIDLSYTNAVTKDIFKEQNYFVEIMNKAEKIILHGVWYKEIPKIYLENQKFFDKTFWALWGGDFQNSQNISKEKRWLFENIKYIISGNKYAYDSFKKDYISNSQLIDCFMYPSNLFKNYSFENKKTTQINIQVGNSANPTNRHLEAFEYLKKYKNNNIKIYSPLSYGDEEYAMKVIQKGKELFGEKFIPIKDSLPFDKYIEFLPSIDIAVFNHKKQGAFGNIITHLGFGIKVYFDNESEMSDVFKEYDLRTFEIQKFDLSLISEEDKNHNIHIVKNAFSTESLKNCLQKVFSYDISNGHLCK